MGESMSKLDIVLVNWNSGDYLRTCLELLSQSPWNQKNTRVFIVDNASKDDSMERLPSDKLQVHCLKNKKNAGFGAACNQAAAIGRSEYILFLNLDVEVSERIMEESISFMADNQEVTVMGCRQTDQEGRVNASCSRYFTFPRAMNEMLGLSFLFPKTFKHATLMKDWITVNRVLSIM
jgi:N-acetylglucosaminyl-diphospho-decaprenol L-rhamnosyltransferase